MIRKIKTTEYLKLYEAMSDGERKEYWSRVGQWLRCGGNRLIEITDRPMAKAQNVVLLSARWSKDDCQAFYDGTLLLSALVGKADTWLPTQLYAKSAYRAVRQMVDELFGVAGAGAWRGGDAIASQPTKKALPMIKTVSKEYDPKTDTVRGQSVVVPARIAPAGRPHGTVKEGTKTRPPIASHLSPPTSGTGVPVRPRHIDQYVHLLPEKTQERAANYGPLMREMGEARENLRLLMDDPGASSASREAWAKKITKIDREVKAILEELDREWAKLVEQGRVVVDELGHAHIIAKEAALGAGSDGEASDTAADGGHGGRQGLSEEDKKRVKSLRCFLRDTRYGDGDKREEYCQKWREKYREMVQLGGQATVTDAVRKAAEHYGIDLEQMKSEK